MTDSKAPSLAQPEAPLPPGLRRVAIDPVSRVEGHGKVTLLVDEQHHIHQVRLHIVEFRGFEAFIEGRPYWEVPVMVQRLCGICPVSHHLAAVKALDAALGIRQIAPEAEQMRRLMHYGQVMQSHALHFFHLASPDLLLGFSSDVARRNIVGVAAQYPEVARQGVAIRRFGQEIIRATSGKRIHGTGAVPGGMNRALSAEDRNALLAEADTIVGYCQGAMALMRRMAEADAPHHAHFGEVPARRMGLVAPDGGLELYDGRLRLCEADGSLRLDQAHPDGYAALIEETTRSWTYMKFPYLRELGPETGWYQVGPLARVQNASHIPTPLAEAERQAFVAGGGGQPRSGALLIHWARMIEMLHCAEVVRELLADAALLRHTAPAEALPVGQRPGEGIGVIEAPRGTLIHHYRVGDDDRITHCNLIVSTTHNNQAMHEAVAHVARQHLEGQAITEGLLNHLEVAIRAYDPCLSCATHAMGQMPLQVVLADRQGQELDRVWRDGTGGGLRRGAG